MKRELEDSARSRRGSGGPEEAQMMSGGPLEVQRSRRAGGERVCKAISGYNAV